MDVSVENPGGLKRRLKVQIPADRVNTAVDEKVKRVGQHARIPGFRPGKAPTKVLYQRYGAQARQEAVSELIQSTYPEAVEKSELNPAGQPEIELDAFEENGPLSFTANIEVYPEIELKGLDAITVEKPVTEVTDADIDKTLERIQDQNKSWEEVERESADGDQVVVDYVGRIDGEAFEGGTGNDIEITLGEQQFLPDMERAMVGRKAGEEFQVDVAFPEDYGAEDLAGKTATFDVTVKAVKEAKPAEIDEEFIKQMGVEEGTMEALRDKIRESLEHEVKHAIDTSVKTQTMDALHEANPIEVPESMVAQEIDRMRKEAMQRMPQQMQGDEEQAKQLLPDDALREQATKRVALGLLIAEVISEKGLELDQDKVAEKMDEIAAGYGDQAEAVKNYYQQNPQLMQGLQAMVMEQQVVDDLLANATITEKDTELDELLNANRQQG
ncbi:trigger factor [Salinisphaera hydrothermalis]|uniref:Trigger factor n=1 Tax=Salinisphaera hydrothermalis (strain C41B8) TaxID=1304275 RepID=A0A084INW5_SALHC|nr:trigger factor [Salinisphaera hydrothermalis]KEZ78399.1 trigger factor [Salinisphaera hydrothermalis C41B8]